MNEHRTRREVHNCFTFVNKDVSIIPIEMEKQSLARPPTSRRTDTPMDRDLNMLLPHEERSQDQ